MGTIKVLNRKERRVCNELLEQKNIGNIYEKQKEVWYVTFNKTEKLFEEIRISNGDELGWKTEKILIHTSMILSDMTDDLADEIEKLNEKSAESKRIYKKLEALPIESLNASDQKAFYIIIGHMYEYKTNEVKTDAVK
jgi:hypothetical protein